MAVSWTESAIEILRRDYPTKGTQIPELLALDFSQKSIRAKAHRLGLKQLGRLWMPDDIELLKEEYPAKGSDIPELLAKGFTLRQIHNKATGLGIKFVGMAGGKSFPWTEEDDDIIRREYPDHGNDIPILLAKGRTKGAITWRAGKLGVILSSTRVIKILYNGEEYDTATTACSAAGIPIAAFYGASNRLKGLTPQEIFDYVLTERKIYADWTDEEVALLKDNYPDKGANIPKLRERHSATSIRSKAAKLGLVHLKPKTVKFQGADMSIRALERYYNLSHGMITSALNRGISQQQLVDRLAQMHLLVDGKLQRTVTSFAEPLDEYIQADGKLWSPSKYCEHFKPFWTVSQFIATKSRHNLTAQQNLDYLEGRFTPDSFANKTSERRARTRINSDILRTAFGYTGTDGQDYYFVCCSRCRRVQLVSSAVFHSFTHDEVMCKTREVPPGLVLPKTIKQVVGE